MLREYAIFRELVHLDLELWDDYVRTLEQALDQRRKDFHERVEREAHQLPAHEREELFDYYSDDHARLAEYFPNTMRASTFVACYDAFVVHLGQLCHLKARGVGCLLRVNDIRGQGVERAKLYLKKVLQVPFPDDTREWTIIKNYGRVRNCLVHGDGKPARMGESKKAEQAVHDLPALRLDIAGRIWIERGFVSGVLKTLNKFLDTLSRSTTDQGPA